MYKTQLYMLSHNRGRPTLQKQIKIEKTLNEFFNKGISANGTSQITGLNIKTVLKYFNRRYNEVIIIDRADFEERVTLVRLRFIMAYERELVKLYQIQNEIDDEISQYKRENRGIIPHGKGMYNERKNLIRTICELIDGLNSMMVAGRSTNEITDETIRDMIIERLKDGEASKKTLLADYGIDEKWILDSKLS